MVAVVKVNVVAVHGIAGARGIRSRLLGLPTRVHSRAADQRMCSLTGQLRRPFSPQRDTSRHAPDCTLAAERSLAVGNQRAANWNRSTQPGPQRRRNVVRLLLSKPWQGAHRTVCAAKLGRAQRQLLFRRPTLRRCHRVSADRNCAPWRGYAALAVDNGGPIGGHQGTYSFRRPVC
jgi:hypothetical protein